MLIYRFLLDLVYEVRFELCFDYGYGLDYDA